MIKSLFFITIALLFIVCHAQGMVNSKSDSLRILIQNENEDSIRIKALLDLGDELILKSHTEALDCYYQSRMLAEKNSDTTYIVYNLIGICDVYSMMGEYKQALAFVEQARELATGNYELLAAVHSRLAVEYFNLSEFDLSLENDKLSLMYNQILKDTIQMAYDYHNIGTYYLGIQNIDSALVYYQRSDSLLGARDEILHAYNNSRMGFAKSYNKEYLASLPYHEKALAYYAKDSLFYEMAQEENYMSSAYYSSHQLIKATEHAQKALQYSVKLNNHQLLCDNYDLLYDIYNKQKDYKKALEYTLLEKAYTDSLEEKNKESIIQSMKTRHRFMEQKKILEATEESNVQLSRQRMQLLIFSCVSVFLLVVVIIISKQNRKKHQKNKELLVELNHVNDSIRKLLSIIGHDLRDSVGNLKNFTQLMHYELLDNKSVKDMIRMFVPMIDSTHGLLENLLTWSKNDSDNFQPQIEKLNTKEMAQIVIGQVYNIAKNKNISIEQNIEEGTICADKNMLLTVLRNLLSNAIKFSKDGDKVILKCNLHDNQVVFSVLDYGVGLNQEQIDKILGEETFHTSGTSGERGSGLGLSLCASFIAKHGGKLTIESEPGNGACFHFQIPSECSRARKIETTL